MVIPKQKPLIVAIPASVLVWISALFIGATFGQLNIKLWTVAWCILAFTPSLFVRKQALVLSYIVPLPLVLSLWLLQFLGKSSFKHNNLDLVLVAGSGLLLLSYIFCLVFVAIRTGDRNT